MGGPIAFRTEGRRARSRRRAVASVHGGGLVTDKPNGPHLQAAKTKTQFLIAIRGKWDMGRPTKRTF
jgi:carboxymethylenebutenolidase